MNLIAVLLVLVACVLMFLVVTKRLHFPLMMEFGFTSIGIGLLLAAEAIHSDSGCSPFVLAARWSFVAFGVFLVMVSLARKKAKEANSSPKPLTENLERVHGGKGTSHDF